MRCQLTGYTAPGGYDAVMAGASINTRSHNNHVVEFVCKHQDALARIPSAKTRSRLAVGPVQPRSSRADHRASDRALIARAYRASRPAGSHTARAITTNVRIPAPTSSASIGMLSARGPKTTMLTGDI